MKLVVGLGNPGNEYQNTRHNLGFLIIDRLSKSLDIELDKNKYSSLYGFAKICEEPVILVKPMTFMNLSGKALSLLLKKYNIDVRDMIVICDDINLEVGVLKIKKKGSSGGHNGLNSIVEHVQSSDFPRLRLGVGKPLEKEYLSEYVLGKFKREEKEKVNEMIDKSIEALTMIFEEGLDKAIAKYNKKNIKILNE